MKRYFWKMVCVEVLSLATMATLAFVPANFPFDGERVTVVEIEWMEPDGIADNDTTIFDFSHAVETGGRPVVRYGNWGDSLIVRYDGGTQQVWSLNSDTLRLLGRESATVRLADTCAAAVAVLPLVAGESVTSPFYLTGDYCGSNALSWVGTSVTTIDGPVTLILPNDTISDAMCVRHTMEGSMRLARGPVAEDISEFDDTLTRRHEERWMWYAPQYRHAVAECERVTYRTATGEISKQVITSRLCPPDLQDYEQSTTQQAVPQRQRVSSRPSNASNTDMLADRVRDIDVRVKDGSVVVSYATTDGDAGVEAVLCDVQGRVYASTTRHTAAAGSHTQTLNTTCLPPGYYLVAVTIDGQVTTRRVYIP